MNMRIRLTINGRARTALLGDSPAARALTAAPRRVVHEGPQ